jgi:glycosyltransferase involved in cell wall biosynthesis
MATVEQTLLTSRLRDEYDLHVITTHRVGSMAARLRIFASALWALRKQLRAVDGPCIAHVHAASRGSIYRKALVLPLAHLWGASTVLHLHAGAKEISEFAARMGPLRRRLLTRGLRSADAIISVSKAGAVELESSFATREATVVNNPLPGPLPAISVERSSGATQLLYLGGFENPVKGGAVLLEALTEVRSAVPSLEVVLAGSGNPPASVEGSGRWAGWLAYDAKDKAISEADIVVLPSTSEGLPIALLEAMAYGKAIVATSVGAIPETMIGDRDGVLVPPGDPASLAHAIIDLAADPKRRSQLGKNARVRAVDYSIDRVVDHLDTVYRRVLAESKVSV